MCLSTGDLGEYGAWEMRPYIKHGQDTFCTILFSLKCCEVQQGLPKPLPCTI